MEREDIVPFAAMNSDSEVMKYFPKTLAEEETKQSAQRILAHFDKYSFGLYAVEKLLTKEFIGFTGFAVPAFDSFFTPCVEIGWRIRKQDWGNGYATEAASACLQYGFQTLHFDEVYSFTSVTNFKSEKVMQKTGMVKVGEFDHPNIPTGHPLCRHVLYRIDAEGERG